MLKFKKPFGRFVSVSCIIIYCSGSQTWIRKTIFWDGEAHFKKIKTTLLKQKNLYKLRFSGNLFFETKFNKHKTLQATCSETLQATFTP